MHKIVYKLGKEDYQSWVRWNVERNYSAKKRKTTILVFIALVAAFIIGGTVTGRSLASTLPTLVMGLVMGGFILYTTSFQGQVKMVWKRSGLSKLEQTGNYPTVTLTLKDKGLLMEAANQGFSKAYGYKDIVGIEEIDRLFLLETTDKTWQFVAKSGFESREAMDEFAAFIKEKMAAAKEEPEAYSREAMEAQENGTETPDGLLSGEDGAGRQGSGKEDGRHMEEGTEEGSAADAEDEVVIRHVDTSNMGKIGKMAHIMAAMAAADKEETEDIGASEEEQG